MPQFTHSLLALALTLTVAALGVTTTQSRADGATLFQDGQIVEADFQSGYFSRQSGSRGTGKYFFTVRMGSSTFGPLAIVEHTRRKMTVQGSKTACEYEIGGRIACHDGSRGTWALRQQ